MAKLPQVKPDVGEKIVKIIDKEIYPRIHRPRMGYSESGSECKRRTWYSFRWAYDDFIESRIMRIFETGNIAEEFMTGSLVKAGFVISKSQYTIDGPFGHILGHIDGIVTHPEILDGECLLEFKTANDANFKKLLKYKVKRAFKGYYYQMTAYMGKLKLKECLFMCYNKNDSTYYIEMVPFDQTVFEEIERSFFDILTSNQPMDKVISASETWIDCRYCPAIDICLRGKDVSKNCRTCQHVSLENEGVWICTLSNKNLTVEEQRAGCTDYDVDIFLEK